MKTNWIIKNILWALVFVGGIILAVSIALAVYTRHGKEITVPDMVGLGIVEASSLAAASGVTLEVLDSVYVRGMERGAVFTQNPSAGSKVKNGRRVVLTINAVEPRRVSMPLLVGLSMRQAKSELASRGLTLGSLVYVPDMATNNVLGQSIGGVPVEAGASVFAGTRVDLKVGLSDADFSTYVPDVTGLKLQRAVDVIQESSLNVGRLVFSGAAPRSYADSLAAVVVSQRPGASDEFPIRKGEKITLYLE